MEAKRLLSAVGNWEVIRPHERRWNTPVLVLLKMAAWPLWTACISNASTCNPGSLFPLHSECWIHLDFLLDFNINMFYGEPLTFNTISFCVIPSSLLNKMCCLEPGVWIIFDYSLSLIFSCSITSLKHFLKTLSFLPWLWLHCSWTQVCLCPTDLHTVATFDRSPADDTTFHYSRGQG